MFSFLTKVSANYDKLAYDFQFKSIDGNLIKLGDFENKVIVVVNVASRCGYTPQYKDLQAIWADYQNTFTTLPRSFRIKDFPLFKT